MRRHFKNYFLASMVAYIFIFMQTMILLMVFWNSTVVYIRYSILLIVCILQIFALWKLGQHLTELDDQVSYRINEYQKY